MIFKKHSEWEGKHSVLSASKHQWLRYTDERLIEYVDSIHAARRGSELHEVAARLIRLGVKLPDNSQTLNAYVNDAIGFRMEPEQILFFSPYAFGTADAICFRDRTLRIFDLKNGKNKASEEQLLVYAAYFCLEYKIKPPTIEYDLRIYQHDDIYPVEVDPLEIVAICERMKELNKLLIDREDLGV